MLREGNLNWSGDRKEVEKWVEGKIGSKKYEEDYDAKVREEK